MVDKKKTILWNMNIRAVKRNSEYNIIGIFFALIGLLSLVIIVLQYILGCSYFG